MALLLCPILGKALAAVDVAASAVCEASGEEYIAIETVLALKTLTTLF